MKIIGERSNIVLANASHFLFLGLITGPVRMIAGLAQAALNGITLVFAKICSYQTKSLYEDIQIGKSHIVRGFIEFLPGSSFCLDMVVDGRILVLTSDHPFRGTLID